MLTVRHSIRRRGSLLVHQSDIRAALHGGGLFRASGWPLQNRSTRVRREQTASVSIINAPNGRTFRRHRKESKAREEGRQAVRRYSAHTHTYTPPPQSCLVEPSGCNGRARAARRALAVRFWNRRRQGGGDSTELTVLFCWGFGAWAGARQIGRIAVNQLEDSDGLWVERTWHFPMVRRNAPASIEEAGADSSRNATQ